MGLGRGVVCSFGGRMGGYETCCCEYCLVYGFVRIEKHDISYFTRSKTDTLLPTGERRHVPSGEKTRFPLANTVPSKLLNWIC